MRHDSFVAISAGLNAAAEAQAAALLVAIRARKAHCKSDTPKWMVRVEKILSEEREKANLAID